MNDGRSFERYVQFVFSSLLVAKHFRRSDPHDEDHSGIDRNHRATAGRESTILGDPHGVPEPCSV
jgi:hypothetical protein